MTLRKDLLGWLFEAPSEPRSAWSVVLWWEVRRIPYNLIVGVIAAASFGVFTVSISSSGHLQPGEDAVEPLALIAAPLLANVLFTGGWVLELIARVLAPRRSETFGLQLFMLGLGASVAVVVLPGLFWGTYRILQLLRIAP